MHCLIAGANGFNHLIATFQGSFFVFCSKVTSWLESSPHAAFSSFEVNQTAGAVSVKRGPPYAVGSSMRLHRSLGCSVPVETSKTMFFLEYQGIAALLTIYNSYKLDAVCLEGELVLQGLALDIRHFLVNV